MKTIFDLINEYKKEHTLEELAFNSLVSLSDINSILNNEVVNRAKIDILRIYLLEYFNNQS